MCVAPRRGHYRVITDVQVRNRRLDLAFTSEHSNRMPRLNANHHDSGTIDKEAVAAEEIGGDPKPASLPKCSK
jgi:hypothetical protein